MTATPGGSLSAAAPEGGALIARPKGAGRPRRQPRLQAGARIAVLILILGYLLGAIGASPLTLTFIDIILVLPFAYRAID